MKADVLRILAALTILFAGESCDRKREKVGPEEPGVDTTTVAGPYQKTIKDVCELRIISNANNYITGSATYSSALTISNWFSAPVETPDLGRLVQHHGAKVQMIALGGGLTAGAQHGGLFRDGQLTAYPNLVARQLGISDFNTPAFDGAYQNGTGFDLRDKISGITFKRVTNDLATVQGEAKGAPPVFRSFIGRVHNFSAPWLSTIEIWDAVWDPAMIGKVANANGVSWPAFLPYVTRFIPERHFKDSTLYEYVRANQPYDFFLLEDVGELFFNNIRLRGQRALSLGDFVENIQTGKNYTLNAIKLLTTGEKKGAVFTVPHFKNLGIAKWDIQLLNASEMQIYEIAVSITNGHIREWAKQHNLAVIDLDVIYSKIQDGAYDAGYGIKVDGGQSGNFFSSDGIYPTILGQAIIANEVCKAINLHYEAKIPLIDLKQYLLTIGL